MEENFTNVSKNVTSCFGQNSIVETEVFKTERISLNGGLYDRNSDVQSEVMASSNMIAAKGLPSVGISNDKAFPQCNCGTGEAKSRVKPSFNEQNTTKVYKSQISKAHNHANCWSRHYGSWYRPARQGPSLNHPTPTCQFTECLNEDSRITVNHNKYGITDINPVVSNVHTLKAANPDNGGVPNELGSYQGKLVESSVKSSDHPTKVSGRHDVHKSASIHESNGISGPCSTCSAEICNKCGLSSTCSDLPTEVLNNCLSLPSQASSKFIPDPFTAQSMVLKDISPFASLNVSELRSNDQHFRHYENVIHKGLMHTPGELGCHEKSTESNKSKQGEGGLDTVSQIVLTLEVPTNKVDENVELLKPIFSKLQTNSMYNSLTVRKSVEMSFICMDALNSGHEIEMAAMNGSTVDTDYVGEEKDEIEYYTAKKVPKEFDKCGLKGSSEYVCNSSQADKTYCREENKLKLNPTDLFGGHVEELENMMKSKKDQIKYNFDFINPSQYVVINGGEKEMPDMDEVAASIDINADNMAVSNINSNGNKVQDSSSGDNIPPVEFGTINTLKNVDMHSQNENLSDHKAVDGKVTADLRRNVDEEFNGLKCMKQFTSALDVTKNNALPRIQKRKRKKLIFCPQKRKYISNSLQLSDRTNYGKIYKKADMPLKNINNKSYSFNGFSLQDTALKQNNLTAKTKINRLIGKPTMEQRRYPKRQRVMMNKLKSPFEFYYPRCHSEWQNKNRSNVTEGTADNIPFKKSFFNSKKKNKDCSALPKKGFGCQRNTENLIRSHKGAHSIPKTTRVRVMTSLKKRESCDPNLINNHVDSKAYNISSKKYEKEVEKIKMSFVRTKKGTLRKKDLHRLRSKVARLYSSFAMKRSGLGKESEQTCVNKLQHEFVTIENDKQVLFEQNPLGINAKSKYQETTKTHQFCSVTKDNEIFKGVTISHQLSLTSLNQDKPLNLKNSVTDSNKKASLSLSQKNRLTDSNKKDSFSLNQKCSVTNSNKKDSLSLNQKCSVTDSNKKDSLSLNQNNSVTDCNQKVSLSLNQSNSVTDSNRKTSLSLNQNNSVTDSNKKASLSLNQNNSVTESNRQSNMNTIIPLDESLNTEGQCEIVGKVEKAKLRKLTLARKMSSSGRHQLDLICTTDQRSVTPPSSKTICSSVINRGIVRGETCNGASSNRVHGPDQGRRTRRKICVYCRKWYSVPYIYTHKKTCAVNRLTDAKRHDGFKKRRMPLTCHDRKRQLPSKIKANLMKGDASRCFKNRVKVLKPLRKKKKSSASSGKLVNFASQSEQQFIQQLQCPLCNYKTRIQFCLKRHLEGHSLKTQVRCDTCNIIFKSIRSKKQWHTLLGIEHTVSMPSKVAKSIDLSVNSSVENDNTMLGSFKRSIRGLNKVKKDDKSKGMLKIAENGNTYTAITNECQQCYFVCSESESSPDLASVRIRKFDMFPLLDQISENIGSKVVVKGKETIEVFEKTISGEFKKTGYVIDIDNALDDKSIHKENIEHTKLSTTKVGFHETVHGKKKGKVVGTEMAKESGGIKTGKEKENVLVIKESKDLLKIREHCILKEMDIIANDVKNVVKENGSPGDSEYFRELLDISWDTNIDLSKQIKGGHKHMPDIVNLFTNDQINDESDDMPDITDLFNNVNESHENNQITGAADIYRDDIESATDVKQTFSHGNYSQILLNECEDGAVTDNRKTSDRQGKGLSSDDTRQLDREDVGSGRNGGNKDGSGDGRKDENNNDDNGKPYSATDFENRNIELFSCLVCDASFSRKSDLMKHLSRIHRLTNLCTLCYFKRSLIQRYSNPVTLRNHKVRDHRKDMVQCVCGTLLIDDKMLNSHLKKFKCNFQSLDSLRSVLIRCDCGKRFSNQELLTSHKLSKCRKRSSSSLNKDSLDSIQNKARRASATVTYNDLFQDSNNNEQKTNQQGLGVAYTSASSGHDTFQQSFSQAKMESNRPDTVPQSVCKANIKDSSGQDTFQQSVGKANIKDSNEQDIVRQSLNEANIIDSNGLKTFQQFLDEADIKDSNASVCNNNYRKSMALLEDSNNNVSVEFGNNSKIDYNLHKKGPVEINMNTQIITAEINTCIKYVDEDQLLSTKMEDHELTKMEDHELLCGSSEKKPATNRMSPLKAENYEHVKKKLGLTINKGKRNAKPDSDGKYPCKVCGRRFKRPYLYVHQKQVHLSKQWVMVDQQPEVTEVSRKKFKCGYCSFVSLYWRTIINHHYRLHQEMELDVKPVLNT